MKPLIDKTAEDRHIDKLTAKGIMLLGATPAPALPNAFPHVLRYERFGRKGQFCRILKTSGHLAQIEFTDGFKAFVNRAVLVRR